MKALFLFAVLIGLVFSNNFGQSEFIFSKNWTVKGNVGTLFNLDGMFIINNSNQRVLEIQIPEGAFLEYNGEVIKVIYNGSLSSSEEVITTSARVIVDYPDEIKYDPPLEVRNSKTTYYTDYDSTMSRTAGLLSAKNSSLQTISNVLNWVHGNITYDISYFGKNITAKTAFKDKMGVCVEYSHTLIALLNSLGFQSRYVSGYVLSSEWQPHSWVETYIENDGWIPLEPTFAEAQDIDSTHIGMLYSTDQSEVADFIYSNDPINLETHEKVEEISNELSKKDFSVSYKFDKESKTFKVFIENLKNNYQFVSYSILFPEEKEDNGALLLKPKEKREFDYSYPFEKFNNGVYDVPVYLKVNDHITETSVTVGNTIGKSNSMCEPVFLIFSVLIILYCDRHD